MEVGGKEVPTEGAGEEELAIEREVGRRSPPRESMGGAHRQWRWVGRRSPPREIVRWSSPTRMGGHRGAPVTDPEPGHGEVGPWRRGVDGGLCRDAKIELASRTEPSIYS